MNYSEEDYNATLRSCEELEKRVARAVDNFMAGYGCCQSVVAAFCDLYGLDEQMALRIGAGFGGGVGRMRMMCGAVSAIVILVGLDCGQTEGSDREGKSACYKVVQQLLEQSRKDNGSLICAEILGIKGNEKAVNSYVASPRTAEYYKTRPCAAKVESAARIFANYLKAKPYPCFVPRAGLEPAQPLWPRDFKSLVSTIPPSRRPDFSNSPAKVAIIYRTTKTFA